MPGDHAVGHRVQLLGKHHVRQAIARHAGLLARGRKRGALEVSDEVRQARPAEQTREVGFVEGDGVRDAVAERSHDAVAVARERPRRSVIEPAAAHREPVRRGEVVERHHRGETLFDATVDDARVVVQRVVENSPGSGSTRAHSTENR